LIPSQVLAAYGFHEKQIKVDAFGSGLINHTWRIESDGQAYILQRINQAVFKHPPDIDSNISLVADYLQQHHPGYFFVAPAKTPDGRRMVHVQEGYYRLFPFVSGSHSVDVVETPQQAYEAASQFGKFTMLLSPMDAGKLKYTIPRFHDLSLRYSQFMDALKQGNMQRIAECESLIKKLESHKYLLSTFENIAGNNNWRVRVTHHDTKISNVLFDEADKGICVIDLDTLMPGYFISDVGDMMRTYLSPVSEEEKDLDKISVRESFYYAIVAGYFEEMKEALTDTEKKHFFFAGKFMIYMQALRFLTDHLNNDIYYGAAYPGHNFVRANNQLTLLERLSEKETLLEGYLP
jgi:Ser/Thr protein kinase RdoA (MazF antagonist)